MAKTVVLLSSGLDSTVNLFAALRDTEVVLALTFNYGQRAAFKEIECSQKIIAKINSENKLSYKIQHRVVELPFFKEFTSTALVNRSQAVPVAADVSIHNLEVSFKTAEKVWVPNRNGVFLNVAAAFAEGFGADFIVPGFNLEEAQTFPDNTAEFLDQTEKALSYSTATKVKTKCYTTQMNKSEIVRYGLELGAPLDLVWPCYFAGEKLCGQCESCQRFLNAQRT